MARPPNIVLIMADQLAPQALPWHGHRQVQTPHLERLAAGGVVFDAAYCNAPLCAPSRFSMLSGRLPSRIDAFDNAVEFPAQVPTFVHYLRRAGYRTCLAGKMHFVGPDQLHGFEERITTDVYPADFLWTVDWDLPEESWVPWYHSMRAVLDAGVFRRSVHIAYDDEVEFEAVRWLHERTDEGDARPFFLTASFMSPHDPYLAPQPWWDLYDGVAIEPPRVPEVPLAQRDPMSRRHHYLTGRHLDAVTPADVLRMRRAYHAVTSYVDAKVGALLRALEETGEAERTLIVFTSDHGDLLGERGMFFKMSFFEWSVRVPLVLHAPFAFAPRRVRQNVSLVDLFPTLLEIAGDGAGAPLVAPIDGTSLTGLATGEGGAWPDTVFSEYTAEGARTPQLMVRRGPLKYVHSEGEAPTLFDLVADPHELENLAGRPAHGAAQRALGDLVHANWDPSDIDARVRESQRRRRLIGEALAVGRRTPWDHQPFRDASRQYFRLLGDVQDAYDPG